MVFKIIVGSLRAVVGSTPIHSRFFMEKVMKRFRAILLLTLCAAIFLSACQPAVPTATLAIPTRTATSLPATATPLPTSKPTLAVDRQALQGQEVRIAFPWDQAENRFSQLIDDFNLTNTWGIRAVAEPYASADALMEALELGRVKADVVIGKTYDLLSPQTRIEFQDFGVYFNDPTWGALDSYQQGSPFEAFAPKANETLPRYTLPLAYDAGLIFYRSSWARELGLQEAPLAWEDFANQMRAGLRANLDDINIVNNGTGGLLLSKSPLSAQSWYAAFGGTYAIQNQVLQLEDEALVASFRALKQDFKEDLTWVGLEPTPYQYFTDNFALAYEGTLSEIDQQAHYLPAKKTEINWETLPYPTEDGKGSIALESVSVAMKAGEPESVMAAWFFVRWLLQPSQQARLAEINSLWPATGHPVSVVPDYAAFHPAWASALRDGVRLTLAPEAADWGMNRYILQDAYLRVYDLEPEYFSNIIIVLKQMLADFPARQQ